MYFAKKAITGVLNTLSALILLEVNRSQWYPDFVMWYASHVRIVLGSVKPCTKQLHLMKDYSEVVISKHAL